jgi:hypothetical protein
MSNDDDESTRIIPSRPQTGAGAAGAASPRTEVAPQRPEIAPPPAVSPEGAATVIRPRPPPQPRPVVGNDGGNMLPVGTYLAEFEITKVLGEGGFGIVYLAEDHSLGRRVALKEYMPSSLAARVGGTQVSVKSERHRETFEAGLKSFVNEARLLAQFDHPSLVKVYRFWEANGTAYMIMPFYEGITLKDQLKAMGAPPDEAWLRELLEPLTEALAVIHDEQCFHRDIAPDNVILLKGSNLPLLLDFGAARRVIGDMTQALTVILKPGYAPVEQYAEVPGMKQGAWTDVYALAAVVYYSITGKTPPTSVARLMNDSYVPMTQAGAGRYSPGFLAAIDRALIVKPEERTQSINDLRRDLGMVGGPTADTEKTQRRTRAVAASNRAAPAADAAGSRSRMPLVAGIALIVLLVGGGGLYALLGGSKSAPAVPVAATTPAAATGAASAVVGVGAPAVLPAVQANAEPKPMVTDSSAALAAGNANAPFDPVHEFERVSAAQSPDFHVDAAVDKPKLRINKDEMSFKVKTEKEGHLYVFQYGTDGGIAQLFPNGLTKNNLVRAGSTYSFPTKSGDARVSLMAGGPPGMDHLLAIVSANPREFAALGLKVRDGIAQTTLDDLKSVAAASPQGTSSVFAGKPVCQSPTPCVDNYGAATFSAEEVN